MTEITETLVRQAAEIIGSDGIAEEEIERRVRELVLDDLTARRLIDWIPEVFGMVLVGHMSPRPHMPPTFQAKTKDGKWRTLRLTVEPIVPVALRIAQHIYHEGPRALFQNLSLRSATVNTVNNLLLKGGSLDGAVNSGVALIGIPAETYPSPKKPTWLGWLLSLFRNE